jgi:membrane fusion protein, multidrug efflux system
VTRLRNFALVITVLLVGACGRREAAVPVAAAGEPAAIEVVTAAAVTRPLGVQIEAVGTALANESVQVTSKTSNTITAIRFREGAEVRAGSVLVELNAAEIRAEVAQAEAALTESESQFRRSRSLVSGQALSAAQLETVEATLKANRARLEAAKARLEDTVIRAGFDGRTGFRNMSVGALIQPGTVITTLDDTSRIKLNFTVPEANLHVLEPGLEVTATSAGLPGRQFMGKVTQIDTRVDPVSRSIQVRAELPNADGSLRPGMFMTVSLVGRESPALLIPEGAIVPEQGHTYVFVVRDGRVERRELQTGRRRPGEVEIVRGLADGERVIVEGTQNVSEGSRVTERAAAAAAS